MFARAHGQRRQDRRRPQSGSSRAVDGEYTNKNTKALGEQEFEAKSWWSAEEDNALRARLRKEILHSFCKADKEKKPPIGSMLMDVFEKPSEDIVDRMRQLSGVMERFSDEY
ncbi:hypothetical protein RUND412_007968 [Rhizina undulata]